MMVVEGVAADSFDVVDSGASRKASDALSIKGFQRTVELSTLARRILLFKSAGASAVFTSKKLSTTTAQVTSYVDDHATELVGAINAIGCLADVRMTPVPLGVLFFLYAVLTRANQSKFLDFAQAVVNGEGVMRGDPAFALRKNLLGRNATQRPSARAMAGLTIKAWNAHYDGVRIDTFLAYKEEQEFPEIKGTA